jgi:hypothetical protein
MLIQTERYRLRPSRLFFDGSLQFGKLKAIFDERSIA